MHLHRHPNHSAVTLSPAAAGPKPAPRSTYLAATRTAPEPHPWATATSRAAAVTPPQPSHTLHLSQARDSTFKGGRTLHLSLITVPSLTHLPEPALERYIHLSVNLYPGSYR